MKKTCTKIKTLNHILAFIDRLVGKISIKKGQKYHHIWCLHLEWWWPLSAPIFRILRKVSHYGIHQHMVNVTSSVMFFMFLMLMNLFRWIWMRMRMLSYAWLGIPLTCRHIPIRLRTNRKEHKQRYGPLYTTIFVPFHIDTKTRKIKNIYWWNLRQNCYFCVLILSLKYYIFL